MRGQIWRTFWRTTSETRIKPSDMAVGQGFEPREPLGSTVFKTAAFDHSASPPKLFRLRSSEATHYSDAASAIKLQRPHFQRLSHPALQERDLEDHLLLVERDSVGVTRPEGRFYRTLRM